MEKSAELAKRKCLNCDANVNGSFCHLCGQSVRDNIDRSIGQLLGEFFGTIFFFDNRFFLSLRYLLLFPCRMTIEFLDGKRKKFISPVTLFLFFNLIYFFLSPLSDYSLSLEDQYYSQYYSSWIQEPMAQKLRTEGLDPDVYAITYQNASDNISQTIMILNIPMIAFFIFLMAFKRRRFYYDSLIFAFHFFSLFMLSWILLDFVDRLCQFLPENMSSVTSSSFFYLFAFIIPLLFAILSMKKFLAIRWYWAIPAGLGVMISVLLSNLIYRFIIFILTFWAT